MSPDLGKIAEAYDIKYSNEGYRNSRSYYRRILNTVTPKPGDKLLDIACGLGDLLSMAASARVDCYGIDLSPNAVKISQKNVPNAQIKVGDAEHLPFDDETFDYVTMLGSLEHLLHPGEGLLEIRRVLKWGGQALLLVPNAYYFPDLLWQVWHQGVGPNHKQIVERFAAVNEWKGFIESGGLKVTKIHRYNHLFPTSKLDWGWYRQNPRRLLKLMVDPIVPFNFSHSFLYVCEKAQSSQGLSFTPPEWPAPPRLVDLANGS